MMTIGCVVERRGARRGVLSVVLLTLCGMGGVEALPEVHAPLHDNNDVQVGLSDLHRGLYSSAEQRFRAAAAAAPGDPVPLFLVSFSRWWRLLLERTRGSYDDEVFDQMIDAVIREGGRNLDKDSGDYRSMAAVGGAHMLRSHVEALRKHYFRGAKEARRGKRLLEGALRHDPSLAMALFPLGAFNYYADNVPLIVKGIRFLLFLPGGDDDLGLRQISMVAESEDPFRIDARLLLAEICASDDELSYREAAAHLDRAIADSPDSPVVLAAAGRLRIRLAEFQAAEQMFARALAAAHEDAPERERQRLRLKLALAEAAIADMRLDAGKQYLSEVPHEGGGMTASLLRMRADLQRELEEKRSGGDGARRFTEGLRLFNQRLYEEALVEFTAAEETADASPPWLAGGVALYSGMAERHLGEERRAKDLLRRATEVHGFRSADRARLELQGDRPGNPECAPRAPGA